MSGAAPLLEVHGVDVRFGGVQALSDVSFSVARNDLLAVIGPNGAGKTTLLNVIGGAIRPAAGRILFRGESIGGEPADRINMRGVVRTFQAAELFHHLTVRENVMAGGVAGLRIGLLSCLAGLGPAEAAMDRLRQAADGHLEAVGLSAKADEPATALPAGQRRLLAIARALATGAELMILDEPAAGLNELEGQALARVIRKISAAGKTLLFVEHDMRMVAELSRRIIVLDRGRVIADGPPETVRSDPRVIEAYLGRPRQSSARPMRHMEDGSSRPLLAVRKLSVSYDGLCALDNVSLQIGQGEIVALIGANGAGKSSLLKAIARIGPGRSDAIAFDGENVSSLEPDEVVARGISLVPEGRQLFPSLTVTDNLRAGRYARLRQRGFLNLLWHSVEDADQMDRCLRMIHALFPVLRERADQLAGTLSGGQGQMLAIARGLMASPRLLLLDEPSLGLGPQVIEEIMACVGRLRSEGITILLVEQNARAALEIADRAYVLANGRIVAAGGAAELLADPGICETYLGPRDAGSAAGLARVKDGSLMLRNEVTVLGRTRPSSGLDRDHGYLAPGRFE